MSEQVKKTSAFRDSTLEEIEMMQKVTKIFEDLGQESLYQAILDDSPNLLREDDLKIHFDSTDSTAFAARLYVFDRYVIVAKPCGEDKSPILPEVWYGVASTMRDVQRLSESSENAESEHFDAQVEEVEEQELLERTEKKQYSVVAWYDLARVKSHSTESDGNVTLTFTKVEKDQVEVSEDIVNEHTRVESSSLVLQLSDDTKEICKIVHESVTKLEELEEEDRFGRMSFGEMSRKETDVKSTNKAKTLDSKSNFYEVPLTEPVRVQKLSVNVEAASFTVYFKGTNLGFKLSKTKESLPFISEVIRYSLADFAGIVVSDRIKAVNDEEITVEISADACSAMISKLKANGQLKIMFLRDYAKAKEVDAQKGIKNLKPKAVKPTSNTKTRRVSNSTLGSTGTKNSAITSQTSGRKVRKRSKGKRSFADKIVGIKNMKYLVTSVKDIREMKKRAPGTMKKNIEKMFKEMMSEHKDQQPLNVLGVVSELYQTEFAYISNLNSLRGCQIRLMQAKKDVPCKKLRNGRLFCEHKNIRVRCSRKSNVREKVITKAELDRIFLNLTTIIKASLFLFNSVNRGLSKIAEKYGQLKKDSESNEKVEISDIVKECCDRYSDIAPFLQMFWAYCRRFTSACTHLKQLRGSNPEFAKECRKLETIFGKKLPNLMQSPVSRITRYHLLFQSMYKYMEKYKEYCTTQDDCTVSQDTLKDSLMRVEGVRNKLFTVADKVNKKVGEYKELQNMVEVHNEIGGEDGIKYLLQPHRRFISNYRVEYQNTYTFGGRENQEERKGVLYLFNDMIAVGAVREANKKRGSIGSFGQLVLRRQSKGKKSNKNKMAVTETELSVSRNSAGKKNETNKSDNSTGSKDPKLYYIEVLFYTGVQYLKAFEKETQKTDNGVLYALRCSYTKKTGESSFDTSNIVFWSQSEEERDEIEATLQKQKAEYEENKLALEKAKARHGSFRMMAKKRL